jgi:hypothetical protein
MATGAIIARIITQYSAKGSKQAQKDITKLGKDFDKFANKTAKAFGVAAAASAAFAIKVGKDAVQGAMEDQKQQVALATALRNVTGATDEAIASTVQYLDKLELLVGVDNKELIPSLQVLTQATKDLGTAQKIQGLALDISAGTTRDLGSVSLALAKAIGGNVSALTRLGVPLDAAAVKSKDLDAILESLAKTFGGQAEKRAETFEFRINRLNLAFNQILDGLGYALIPVLEQFATVIQTQILPQLAAWIDANKDELAAGLGTILAQIPVLIQNVTDFFGVISRNLGTLKVLSTLLLATFAGAKVYAGVAALIGIINLLRIAFVKQAAAGTAAGIATAFATGGVSALGAAAAIAVFAGTAVFVGKQLTKNNKELSKTEKATTTIAKDYSKVVGTTTKVLGNTVKLTAEQKKQLASQEALNKLRAMGVVPTSETNPIQLEAVRLNLLKEQNLAQVRMYDQLLANYNATERMNIAAQRYADILTVIADSRISEEEVNLLASKWNITNYEVLKYIASVTGNVNLGSGWDAAGLAAADGWKTALAELNAYLAAVGKGAFVAPQFIPGGGGGSIPPVGAAGSDLLDEIVKKFIKPDVIPSPMTTMPGYQEFRAGERGDKPKPLLSSQLPDYQSYRAGERGSINVTVNNAGNTVVQSDLQESIRNGLLAGQTSGRSINARKLDL